MPKIEVFCSFRANVVKVDSAIKEAQEFDVETLSTDISDQARDKGSRQERCDRRRVAELETSPCGKYFAAPATTLTYDTSRYIDGRDDNSTRPAVARHFCDLARHDLTYFQGSTWKDS